ncbi:hypothetical protein GCM10022222_51490 [Amycolatopsis ultiminotia]|uniref:S-adenosyl methyltransferase n=2 Tax=Amycolatopsis ultiminotia TaxID=543629 RepID=A0ABP6X4L5_9PSEU
MYDADHRLLDKLEQITPDLGCAVRDREMFIERAARWAVKTFRCNLLVLGAEVPVGEPLHRRVAPPEYAWDELHAVYVEDRELLLAKAHAWIADGDSVRIVSMPRRVPDHHDVSRLFRDHLPLSVVIPGLLDTMTSDDARTLLDHVRSLDEGHGVCVVATHACDPGTPAGTSLAQQIQDEVNDAAAGPVHFRSPDAIAELFTGYTLVGPPGPAQQWFPHGPALTQATDAQDLIAGIVAHTWSTPTSTGDATSACPHDTEGEQ